MLLGISLLAYLLGSLPCALLVGRWAAGLDLRRLGSGNLGATNAARVLGWKLGLLVLLADAGKGAAALILATEIGLETGVWLDFVAFVAVCGHVWPPWTGFRGGKGVATAAGCLAFLAPLELGMAVLVFVAVLAWRGFASLGSLVATAFLPLVFAVEALLGLSGQGEHLYLALALLLLLAWTHRENLARLRKGEESKWRS